MTTNTRMKKKILKPRQQSKIRVVQTVGGTVWFNKDGVWTDKPYLKAMGKKLDEYCNCGNSKVDESDFCKDCL